MTPDQQARDVAGRLPAGAKRALLRIGNDWTFEGMPGPKREDAYSLWWGHSAKWKLIEKPRFTDKWAYRPTPLGRRVRTILQEEARERE